MPPSVTLPPERPLALFGLAITGVLASAGLGAVTNSINAWVSPDYFRAVLGWQRVADVWQASIAQGIFEGLCFGVCFSVLFTAGVGIITPATCSYWLGFRYLLGVVAGGAGRLGDWRSGRGGAGGLESGVLSEDVAAPPEFAARLPFAWVGGSIWGVERRAGVFGRRPGLFVRTGCG